MEYLDWLLQSTLSSNQKSSTPSTTPANPPTSASPKMNVSSQSKGLFNNFGENNCFLNVIIQTLWHLDSFRIPFLKLEEHRHQGPQEDPSVCIFCAMKVTKRKTTIDFFFF